MRHLLLTALLALVGVGAAFASGPYHGGALMGIASSSGTALASLLLLRTITVQRRGPGRKPLQAAFMVMLAMFATRIVVVAAATAAVVRGGDSVVAFVVAFFVPYFIFAAIEGAYVHSIARGSETLA
jgi:hypothetical protein